MQISSREVNREIREQVRPLLREKGFTKTNARNAWRFRPSTIEVINFQSFNSEKAASLGCTSFSFCVNLGVYYLAVHRTPWASKHPVLYATAPLAPPEYACHARLHLRKGLTQREYPREDIWYVAPDGSNVAAVVEDAREAIGRGGLPWLAKYTDLNFVLSEYLKPRSLGRVEHVCAFGTTKAAAEGSAVAFELGEFEAAARLWEGVVNSDYYAKFPETIKMANDVLSMLREQG